MRLGWVGFHVEGLPSLRALLEQEAPIHAVLTLEPELAAKRSGTADYAPLCREFGAPLHYIRNVNDEGCVKMLTALALDVVFVIGWTQLVRREALGVARVGMIGAHASLLPQLRGRAPINWALIRGLPQTGNSLIWLAEQADRGAIIDQTPIPITPYDTCASLYQKVADSNKDMILRVLPRLLDGDRPGLPQTPDSEPDLPGRRLEDGVVTWAQPSARVYDFIRALTRPYPGALAAVDGRRYYLWEAALAPGNCRHARPGEILGPVVSPRSGACGLAVACETGSVTLLELEDDEGHILTGRDLSDLPWIGKVMGSD